MGFERETCRVRSAVIHQQIKDAAEQAMSQSDVHQSDIDGSPSAKNTVKANRAKESKVKFLHTLLKLWLP
eukprot:7722461-Karenia_brevis.AAC.1